MYHSSLFLIAALIGTSTILLQPVVVFPQSRGINTINTTDYFERAVTKTSQGDYQGAIADYSQAISINPKNSMAYYNRALLFENKLNDRIGAIQDFRRAAQLYREQADINSLRAAISDLQRLGATE